MVFEEFPSPEGNEAFVTRTVNNHLSLSALNQRNGGDNETILQVTQSQVNGVQNSEIRTQSAYFFHQLFVVTPYLRNVLTESY